MSRGNQFLGGLLIAFGLIFLLAKLLDFTFVSLWPAFLLVPGLAFHVVYVFYRQAGFLIPGGILTTYALLFFFCELAGYGWMEHLWPVFILGPAIGLFEFYFMGGQKSGVLIASLILFTIGGTFLFISLFSTMIPYLLGLILIILGIFLVFGRSSGKQKTNF